MGKQSREDQFKPVTGKTPPSRRAPNNSPRQGPVPNSQKRGQDK